MKWKLTPEQVDQIREARRNGESVADLAVQYGVSRQSIYSHLGGASTNRRQSPVSRVTTATQESRPYRESTFGYVPSTCGEERCGQPQEGAGRPRRGWLQLRRAGHDVNVWCCSFNCLSRYAIHCELAGGDAA